VWSYQLDGIFIGATRGRAMRNAMVVSFAVYLVALAGLVPLWANHGLWLAFLVFMVARALTLLAAYPALARAAGSKTKFLG
jgi:MATE family multidrug resistance protein